LLLHQIIILAVVQGITEFFPISSSGHLILVPHVFDWSDQGLEMDVAVHLGTLGAVIVYFWKDVLSMIGGFFSLIRGKMNKGSILFLHLCVATIPAVIFGTVISMIGTAGLRTVILIGWMSIIYGALIFIADRLGKTEKTISDMTGIKAFIIGCAQALALIPGTSRVGSCLMATRFLGFNRSDAARFSFLMAIPAILAAASHTGYKMYQAGDFALYKDAAYAAGVAFIAGLIAINFMMKWLQKADLTPFVIYRFCLGAALLVWGYYF